MFYDFCYVALSFFQITGMLQLMVLMASETEARFTSAERIVNYIKVGFINAMKILVPYHHHRSAAQQATTKFLKASIACLAMTSGVRSLLESFIRF